MCFLVVAKYNRPELMPKRVRWRYTTRSRFLAWSGEIKDYLILMLCYAVDIEGADRVERRKTKSGEAIQDQPRTIVCRLRDWEQKEQVLRNARREKPNDLYISEDLSPATLPKRESRKFLSLKQRQRIVLTTC